MRRAALLAALACVASAAFSGDSALIFDTWDSNEDVKLVDDFDHISQISHPQVHQEEHSRRKRNAVETARFAAGNPITHACDRPGYTGQYCEFPICESFNPASNPQQYLRDEGYIVDLSDLGACNRKQQIIVDDTMYDIRITVQSLENVSPKLAIADGTGYFGTPDKIDQEPDRYVAHFNTLPPGLYTVIPSASASTLDSHCILTTTAQTVLTISGGFQTDDRDRNDFPNENAAAHQFNSIMLTLHGGRAPATLKTVTIIGPDNYLMRPRSLDRRYGCQYEFYFDSLFCFTRGSYALIAEGVDFYGNLFRRVAPFECTYAPAPTTVVPLTTPQPTNPTACANGGVLLASGGGTTCICQDHWASYDCSQPLCINGGTLLQGKCFCPIGFEGVHCDQVKCEPTANFGMTVDHPTLVIVVRARFYQNDMLKQVQQAIDEAVENLQFDPEYLTRFHLVVFNNRKILLSRFYTSIQKFDFDFEQQTQLTDRSGKCEDDVLAAVSTALTEASISPGSLVYVITDALTNDYSSQIDAIMQLNSFAKATINFVYVQPDPNQKCPPADPSDPGFRAFDDVANRFGGMAWSIQNRKKVSSVLFGHMNSILYKSQLMLDLDREECSKGLNKVMQLEKSTETLVFISRGRDFDLDITAPDGARVIPRLVTTEGIFTVRRWNSPIAGTYMIKASTESHTAACSLRAYQASQHSMSSTPQTEVYWAITTDVDTDAMMNQPLAGMDNHPVFHVENFGDDYDHAFAFLNMYTVRNGEEKEVYASNGLFRGGCSFQFYFPKFSCRPNENLHYEFNLRNEEGFYVQRAGVMTCFNYVPTQAPPSDCQNAGVKFNGTCLCQPHYEGDHCESIICENGGTVLFGTCQCPAGWNGQFCTLAQCPESGPLPSLGYHVDMAFLVELTQKGVNQIDQLLLSLPEIIRDVQSQHVEWVDRLVLIGYDSNGVVGMVDTPIANTEPFFDALNKWSEMNPQDISCTIQIWQALNSLLTERRDGKKRRQLADRSIINIFEATAPNLYDGDESSPLIASVSEELLEKRAITNIFRMKGWDTACKGYESDWDSLEKVARRGDGMMYTLGNGDMSRAIRMIPTLFSSSIVYKYHEPWCDHQAMVYFPVDAYTQTITAVVRGSNAALDLRRYDGTSLSDEGRVTILNDEDNLVVEFRNPCPADWEPVSQYCMYLSKSVKKNFTEASDLCASMGGFMSDDLGQAKNNWLDRALGQQQGWLGLSYINGEWLFQEDYGSTIAPPKNFNKWITGDAPADDSKGACAYIFNGLWYPMECDREYVVICQKHMYSYDNMPSNLGDDDLSPGKYLLVVQTDLNVPDHSCNVEVRVQSQLNVEFGFVDGLRRDAPHPVANVDSNENRVVSSFSIGKSKTQSVKLEHVLLRTDDAASTLLEAATFDPRVGCTYDYVSQPLSCDLTNGTDFSVVLIGVDDTGNTFQRYSTSLCTKWYDCSNGGVYSNGQCLCPDYYTGDQCETPLCQNGGQLSFNADSCACSPGFGGDACQYVQCDANSNTTFTDDSKAFVLVLEKSANTADAIQKIALSIHQLNQNMWNRHEGWIDKWMVQTFTLDGTVEELSVFVSTDQFTQYLLNIANQAKLLPGTCEMPIWDALDNLFDSSLSQYLPGSEVLIVSAAAPDLSTPLSSIHATMEKFDVQTPIVDFLHIENVNCWITDWEKDVGDFANFIATTGGTMFRTEPDRAGEAVEEFVPSRYAAEMLSYSDPYNCKNNDIYIQVDSGMSLVYVLVAASDATMEITTPLNDYIGYVLLWYSSEQQFWGIYPKYPGIYKISINSAEKSCFPVVYGSGGSVVTGGQHAAQVFSGFIQNYNTLDTPTPYAVYGAVNFPVFFLYELPGRQLPTETLYTARMTRKTIDGKVEESYTSDVDLRDGCSYNYMGKAFTCVAENDVITLSISGVDGYSQPFTRQSTTYCKKDQPKPCQNGGVYSGGACICPDYYAGNLCETPVCQNGGFIGAAFATTCRCLSGFSGAACQYVQCDANSNATFTDDGKAFVLVLEKSANTADAIQKIAQSIHQLKTNMWDRHEGWIDKWMVQTFTLDGTVDELSAFTDTDQFAQYLLNVATEAKLLPGTCEMPIWKALDNLFDSALSVYLPGSELLIVSAAAPDLSTPLSAIHATMEKFDVQTPIVDFLHIENVNCWITDWEADVTDFATFISTTGGIMFRAEPSRAGEAVEVFVPTRYAPQELSFSDPHNCKNNDIFVQVDTGMSLVYVMVGGVGTVEVTTPLNDSSLEAVNLWDSQEQGLWSLKPKYPGIYKIQINSDTAACFPVVYGSGRSFGSDFPHAAQVFSGFIQNDNFLDTPRPYALYGAVNFPVFFLYELPGNQLPTETLYTARMTRRTIDGETEESYTSDVDLRDGCSYNYIGKAFTCVAENDVITLSISGVDSNNQPFTRQSTTYCKKDQPKPCKNGGVYSGGACICPDYYTGELCETAVCQNGGYLISTFATKCTCMPGFTGDACQFVQCDRNSNANFTNDGKALVLVLEKSANTADAIELIALSIHKLVENMWDRHENWIDKYLVHTFAADGTIAEMVLFHSPDDFTQKLLSIADEARTLPGLCQMHVWRALDYLFDSQNAGYLPGSEVLIVSAAAPTDANLDGIHATMEKFDIQTPIVDFLHIETASCPIEDWQKNVADFSTFLSTTGGVVIRSKPRVAGEVVQNFVPTRYAAQRLSYSDPHNCKDNDIYVQVDTGMSLLYVLVGKPNAKMTVTTPKKDEVGQLIIWNSDEQAVWGIYPKYPGIYKITINSDSPACFPVVYGSGAAVVTGGQHASQVFSGFIQDSNKIDTPKPYAVFGAVNFPVFFLYELEGHQLPTETLYTARMTRRTIDGDEEESYTSDVDLREGCSYNYVGKAFSCVAENDVITLSISGVDGNNQPFTRQTTTYCKTDTKRIH